VPKEQPAVIDLTGVSFIASLGIRMLLGTARALDRYGARLVLFGPQADVMEIIETTALTEIIPVVETEAEAVAAAMA
jgi:anti-anti-sigma factor